MCFGTVLLFSFAVHISYFMRRYPFEPAAGKKQLEFFDVFHYIVAQQVPPLDREQFSDEFCDFIEKWYCIRIVVACTHIVTV